MESDAQAVMKGKKRIWFQHKKSGLAVWEYMLLLVFLLIIPLSIDRSGILHDEPDWIHQSLALELFLTGDFSNPYWDIQHYTLTEPPLSRYIIGIGRWLGGYTVEDLTNLDRFYQGDPSYTVDPDLIRWSRVPMVPLAIISVLVLFWVVRRCAGRLAAFFFLGLVLLNPAMVGWLMVAQSDLPVLFFVILALPPAIYALEAWQALPVDATLTIGQTNRVLLWLVLVGVACGLAAAAKLNGFAAALAGSGLGILLALFDRRPFLTRLRWQFAIRAAILPVLVGLLVMIALNPFLYREPFARIGKMLAYRAYEMNWQANTWPEYRVPEGWERLPYMVSRVFQDYSALRFPLALVVNLGLFLAGFYQMAQAAMVWLRGSPQGGNPASLALLMVGSSVSLPMFTTIVDWNRYYLFPVVFSTIAIAVGVSSLASWLWNIIEGRRLRGSNVT